MKRMRRLRANETLRSLVRETQLTRQDLIYPIFVIEGEGIANPVDSMPGIRQYSIDRLDEELERVCAAGITALMLFGIPSHKDETGSQAYRGDGVVFDVRDPRRHFKKPQFGLCGGYVGIAGGFCV